MILDCTNIETIWCHPYENLLYAYDEACAGFGVSGENYTLWDYMDGVS